MQYFFFQTVCLLLLVSPLPKQVSGQVTHMQVAQSFVGTTELTGHNDGPEVEMFLRSIGRKKGDSWCAAFVSYCLTMGKVKEPVLRSGMARAFITKTSIKAKDVLTGKVKVPDGYLVVYGKGNTIYGHIGLVKHWNKVSGQTIEGNTSSGDKGSQSEGEGVYERTRSIQPANYFRITHFPKVGY